MNVASGMTIFLNLRKTGERLNVILGHKKPLQFARVLKRKIFF